MSLTELLLVVALVVLGLLVIYAFNKMLKAIFNLYELKKGVLDSTVECRGLVFNKEAEAFEEDSSIILPF